MFVQTERANQVLTVNSGCGSPTRIMRTPRIEFDQSAQRPQRFGDSLVRLEIAEGADERRSFVEAQRVACCVAIGVRNPGAMRNGRDRALRSPARASAAPRNRCGRSAPRDASSSLRVIATPS